MKSVNDMRMPDSYADMNEFEKGLTGGDRIYSKDPWVWEDRGVTYYAGQYIDNKFVKGTFADTIKSTAGVDIYVCLPGQVLTKSCLVPVHTGTWETSRLNTCGKASIAAASVLAAGAVGVSVWQIVEACED